MSENDNSKDKIKVGKPTIRLAGDVDNCGHCKEGDSFFKDNAAKVGANYEYYHIESDKGREIADKLETGPDDSLPIPAIEYCKTVENEGEKEEKCDYVEGFSKSDWDDKLNYKRPNNVDEEIDELFGGDDNKD